MKEHVYRDIKTKKAHNMIVDIDETGNTTRLETGDLTRV